MRRSFLMSAFFLLVIPSACRRVPGVAQVLNGVTPEAATEGPQALQALAEGSWAVSPDQVEVELQEIRFVADSGNEHRINLDGCTAGYDRAQPTLSQRLGCDFAVPAGSYTGLGIDFEPPLRVLIDDDLNGLYTDGAGLTRSPPAGGASFSPFSVAEGGMRIQLAEPLVVDEQPVQINVVVTALHSVIVQVQGDQASFSGGPGVQLFATPNAVGAAAFYSGASTAGTYSPEAEGNPTELSLVYEDASTPSYAFLFPGTDHRACIGENTRMEAFSASPGELNKEGQTMGGYLGLDGEGTLCFALPKNPAYTEYQALFAMPEVQEIGTSTTLSCEVSNTAPAPVSGSTWSTGCPELTPTAEGMLRLLAN